MINFSGTMSELDINEREVKFRNRLSLSIFRALDDVLARQLF